MPSSGEPIKAYKVARLMGKMARCIMTEKYTAFWTQNLGDYQTLGLSGKSDIRVQLRSQ